MRGFRRPSSEPLGGNWACDVAGRLLVYAIVLAGCLAELRMATASLPTWQLLNSRRPEAQGGSPGPRVNDHDSGLRLAIGWEVALPRGPDRTATPPLRQYSRRLCGAGYQIPLLELFNVQTRFLSGRAITAIHRQLARIASKALPRRDEMDPCH